MKLLFFITLMLFFSNSWASECQNAYVKIIFNQKAEYTKEILCKIKTTDNMLYYVSKSCENDGCEILKRKKEKLKIPELHGNFGSPGFKICEALGGIPQILEFASKKNSREWESTERCLFGSKDFVEISYLVSEWKTFIHRN